MVIDLTKRTRVLLVDPYLLFAELVQVAIDADPNFIVVGIAGTMERGVREARSLKPDLVVCESKFPDGNSDILVRALRKADPAVRVLIVSEDPSIETKQSLLDAGANGYLMKTANSAQLLSAMRTVVSGGTVIGP